MTYTDHLTLLKNKYFIGRFKKKQLYQTTEFVS